jgi:hypothetical protein
VTKIVGGHNLYFGAYVVAAEKNEMNSPYIQGIVGFDNTDAAISTGNAFADMLTGQIASFYQVNQKVKYYNRYKVVEPYFQDDWHVYEETHLEPGVAPEHVWNLPREVPSGVQLRPGRIPALRCAAARCRWIGYGAVRRHYPEAPAIPMMESCSAA